MNFPAITVLTYGILLFIGGIVGHIKANSAASLFAGTVFAGMVIVCAVAMFKNIKYANIAAMVISLFLGLFFLYRFSLSYRFMPAGLMVILSFLVLGTLFLYRKK